MSYDLYVELSGEMPRDVDAIVKGIHKDTAIQSIYERIPLLACVAARNESTKSYAVGSDRRRGGGYKSMVHAPKPENTPYVTELIQPALQQLRELHLVPSTPNLSALPLGSWFLQFEFTLAKPWMSKDDDPFYVAESVNPVHKDKVFKVPMMSAASWKGLLRWTAMHTRLAQPVIASAAKQSPERFAQERFVQTLLFGDEKGEEPGQTKDFAAYLDALKPEARKEYERLLRVYYELKPDDPLPHHSGRLMFYPTFFDQIDVEVINPHSRKTKAGTHPIYLECVPQDARGTFSLLYIPFDLVGQSQETIVDEAGKHLRYIALIIKNLFLTYGFSAKRSSGYGVAKDEIAGLVKTGAKEKKLNRLSQLAQEVKDVRF